MRVRFFFWVFVKLVIKGFTRPRDPLRKLFKKKVSVGEKDRTLLIKYFYYTFDH